MNQKLPTLPSSAMGLVSQAILIDPKTWAPPSMLIDFAARAHDILNDLGPNPDPASSAKAIMMLRSAWIDLVGKTSIDLLDQVLAKNPDALAQDVTKHRHTYTGDKNV